MRAVASVRAGAAKEGDSAPDGRVRAFLLPVQGTKNLAMPDVMLEGHAHVFAFAQKLRHSAQPAVTDMLYYMAPQSRPVILDSLVKALHGVAARFYRRNPAFAGSVNVIGHSLGTVLMYDLLSNQPVAGEPARPMTAPKLRLEVHDLVMTGSPLAVFLSLRGAYLCDRELCGRRRPVRPRVQHHAPVRSGVPHRTARRRGPVRLGAGGWKLPDGRPPAATARGDVEGASSAWVRAAPR